MMHVYYIGSSTLCPISDTNLCRVASSLDREGAYNTRTTSISALFSFFLLAVLLTLLSIGSDFMLGVHLQNVVF